MKKWYWYSNIWCSSSSQSTRLQHYFTRQVKLNNLVDQFSRDSAVATQNLKLDVKSKLQLDKEFYSSCSSLQRGKEPAQKTEYDFEVTFIA